MSNVKIFPVIREYQAEELMYQATLELVRSYAGQMSTPAAIGVLELVKHAIVTDGDI